MGCGKSKLSVAIDNSPLRRGKGENAAARTRRVVQLEFIPQEKENCNVIKAVNAREENGESMKREMSVEPDNMEAKALPCPEDGMWSQGRKEEQEEEKADETLEAEEGAAVEEDKDTKPEEGHGDGDDKFGRLISHDSPDNYFSSGKDDDDMEGILSEYNSPLHAEEAYKQTQDMPGGTELEAPEEEAPAAVAVNPAIDAADRDQMNPAPATR